MRGLVLALLVGGCDAAFGFQIPADAPADGPVDVLLPLDVVLADHDEDGDGVDDAIDVCPGRSGDQLDTDGDGVGDACDPHPTLPIDRLRYFSSLESFAGWSMRAGTWIQVADAVQVSSSTGNQLALLDLGALIDPTVIAVIDGVVPASTGHVVGVSLVTDASVGGGLPPGASCYEYPNAMRMVFYDNRTTPVSTGDDLAGAVGAIEVRLQASSEQESAPTGPPRCQGVRATSEASIGPPGDPAPIGSAHVGLYTYFAAATFQSVTVIDRRP